jgi:DNA-binding transcriptional ArsR family regulator
MSNIALPIVCEPRTDLTRPEVTEAVLVGRLLADATRASILRMLRSGPHCVCELAMTLGERENNVSNHLARLRRAGLVRARRHDRNARFLYYERDEAACAAALARMNEILR